MLDPLATVETVKRQAYPSWRQFAWLYLMSLLACAACLRRWAQYRITSGRVVIRNGCTGREIEAVPLDRIAAITLRQGPIAQLMGIGALVVGTTGGGQVRLQGINDPEAVRNRLEAMRPAGGAPTDERTAP